MSKTRHFYETEKIRQTDLIRNGFFGESEFGNGNFRGKNYPFVLQQKAAYIWHTGVLCTRQLDIGL